MSFLVAITLYLFDLRYSTATSILFVVAIFLYSGNLSRLVGANGGSALRAL